MSEKFEQWWETKAVNIANSLLFILNQDHRVKIIALEAFEEGYSQALADNALALKIYEKIKKYIPQDDCDNCLGCPCAPLESCIFGFSPSVHNRPDDCRKFFGGSDAEVK